MSSGELDSNNKKMITANIFNGSGGGGSGSSIIERGVLCVSVPF
jgi:hypothetical protein